MCFRLENNYEKNLSEPDYHKSTYCSDCNFILSYSFPCLECRISRYPPHDLANGLQVVIVKNTLAPVVTTQINYLVGSNKGTGRIPRHGTRPGTYDVSWQSRFVRCSAR